MPVWSPQHINAGSDAFRWIHIEFLKSSVASRPSKGNTCAAEIFKAAFPSWQGSPQLPSRIAFACAARLTFGKEWLNHKMKDSLLCGVSLFTLSPSCPLGNGANVHPRLRMILSVNCQLLPHHFKYKLNPRFSGAEACLLASMSDSLQIWWKEG